MLSGACLRCAARDEMIGEAAGEMSVSAMRKGLQDDKQPGSGSSVREETQGRNNVLEAEMVGRLWGFQQAHRWWCAGLSGGMVLACVAGVLLFGGARTVEAEDRPGEGAAPVPAVEKLIPLNPEGTVLLDHAGKRLLLKTVLCLRDGLLEMLICPKQTKEHESILTIDAKAQVIHAGLLALGCRPGHPVVFEPEFVPPSGQRIEIYFNWTDPAGKPQRRRAQELVRHATARYFETPLAALPEDVVPGRGAEDPRYDESGQLLLFYGPMTDTRHRELRALSGDPAWRQAIDALHRQGKTRQLEAGFVFAGSRFGQRRDGSEVYLAERGSLICVANFPDAMIDLDVRSTASNDAGLLFEPWTERLPEVGSEVLVELIPVPEKSPGRSGETSLQ